MDIAAGWAAMRTTMTVLLVAALALAGCADDHPSHSVDCPDGTTVQMPEDHHNETFDPMELCIPPVPPALTLTGIPDQMMVYEAVSVNWSMDLGDLERAHSMFNAVLVSDTSKDVSNETEPEAYGEELTTAEHQDLPFSAEFALSFAEPGTYHIRGFGRPEGQPVWSDEVVVEVTPVVATGTTLELVHGAGNALGEFTPAESTIVLGDAIVLKNDDVTEHVFTFSGPACSDLGTVTVAMQSSSEALLPLRPGTCDIGTDDLQALSASVRVTAPGA